MPRAADGKGACSHLRRGTTTMIGIGIVFSVVGLGYLCWALFDLIVYALPAVVGVSAGFAAYHSGAGVLGAVIVAPIAGGFTLGVGQAALETYRSPKIRTAIAFLFAVPAAWAGYMLTLGMAQLGVPSLAWQQAFALFGSMVVGATAWERLMHPPEPPGGASSR
jgi:hypothetical protein